MPNSMSMLASAEMTRRLVRMFWKMETLVFEHPDTLPKVQHDIIDEKFQWPGVTVADQKELLYGAAETLFFEGQKWGGMSADPGIYIQ